MNVIPITAAGAADVPVAGVGPKQAAPKAAATGNGRRRAEDDRRQRIRHVLREEAFVRRRRHRDHRVRPCGRRSITSGSSARSPGADAAPGNGETVTFKNVASPVDVFAVYDEKQDHDGAAVRRPPAIGRDRIARRPRGRSPAGPRCRADRSSASLAGAHGREHARLGRAASRPAVSTRSVIMGRRRCRAEGPRAA